MMEAWHGADTVILVDAADATSSGAPGDSNAILRALVLRPVRKAQRLVRVLARRASLKRTGFSVLVADDSATNRQLFSVRYLYQEKWQRIAPGYR